MRPLLNGGTLGRPSEGKLVSRTRILVILLAATACRSQPLHQRADAPAPIDQQHAEGSPQVEFWRWFRDNDARLFDFERDREKIFDDLGLALHRVHPDLTFEFGPDHDHKRDFVVSAGGIREAFPMVRTLVAAAPELDRWNIIAFRPRRKTVNDIDLNGVHVRALDVSFTAEPDGDRIGITLLIPGFRSTPNRTFEQIGYLLLDEALGELAVETRLGFITFAATTSTAQPKQHALAQLPDTVDNWPRSQ
jgi:hypothetical protein